MNNQPCAPRFRRTTWIAALVALIGIFRAFHREPFDVPVDAGITTMDAPPPEELPAGLTAEKPKPVVFGPDHSLPQTQDRLWQSPAPEPALAEFQAWAEAYQTAASEQKVDMERRGAALAGERRSVMRELIKLDPERALQRAVPEALRRALPSGVREHLEQRVDDRGDFTVTAAGAPLDGRILPKRVEFATVSLPDGVSYEAFPYGRRSLEPSRVGIPIHGIALDGRLALSEWPGRVLEPVELSEAKQALSGEPVCPTSNQVTRSTGQETAVKIGKEVEFYCGPRHAASDLIAAANSESALPPGFGVKTSPAVVAASDGEGQTVPSLSPDGDPDWTTGSKRIAVVRVNFLGTNYHAFSDSECADFLDGVDAAWNDWSYGRCRVRSRSSTGSFITPILDLPHIAGYYDADPEDDDDQEGDSVNDIWALASVWAMAHGRPPGTYDFLVVLAGDAPIKDDEGEVVWWGGLAQIGKRFSILRSTTVDKAIGVGLHEFGHNLGLRHSSNLWTTPQLTDSIFGIDFYQFGAEYGDRYCRMGKGGLDYTVRYKEWLNWLDPGNFPVALDDGTYTIREHDLEEKSGIRGLQVPFQFGGDLVGQDSLTVEYRLDDTNDPGNPLLLYGAQIHLIKANSPKSYLLDATPETANHEPLDPGSGDPILTGNLDSPLLPGRTFAFSKYSKTVYLTNLEADPAAGKCSIHVEHGTPSGNVAPTGSILPWTPNGAVGQKVYFTADADDADDDTLAYHWQVAGQVPFENSPTVGMVFPSTGTKQIKCIVSDRHGGLRTMSMNFSVVTNGPPTITAISDRATNEDVALTNIPFTVNDSTSDPSSLTTTVTNDNPSLFPAGSLAITSTGGGGRRLSATPAADRHGVATVTIKVSDGALSATEQFKITVNGVTPGTDLIADGGTWKYWDQDAAPDPTWKNPSFSDAAWSSGTARFVYNQGIIVPRGWTSLRTPGRSRTACYFRNEFSVVNRPLGTLTLKVLCDDGMVVYMNGLEVYRRNMPEGTPKHTTTAESSVEGADESRWTIIPLSADSILPGTSNTIAVEVHDADDRDGGVVRRGAGDVAFDAQLQFLRAPIVSTLADRSSPEDTVAGPYSFTASDFESGGNLDFFAESSNTEIVANEGIKMSFSIFTGARLVTCTPMSNATGTTMITVKVSDGGSETWRSFNLTITPVNDPPLLQPVPPLSVPFGSLVPVTELHVSDVDSPLENVVINGSSNNTTFLPNAGVQILPGSSLDRRWLRLTPNPLASLATVTLNATDGLAASSQTTTLRVNAVLNATSAPLALIQEGDSIRYWANALPTDGRGNPVDFTAPEMDDRAWPQGRGQLGYGDEDESTVIPTSPFRVTTYFRKSFRIEDPSRITDLALRYLRDDGVVIYLNGQAIATSNMPRTYTASTPAVADIPFNVENEWHSSAETSAVSLLRAGWNVLAAEVHQAALPTTAAPGDLGFSVELLATTNLGPPVTQHTLVPQRGIWRYWDQSSYPDDTWRLASFEDDGWGVGPARLGYGIGGEATVVNANSDFPSQRNPSVLLRHVFDVADPKLYTALHLYLMRDDAAVVYLNGTRAFASNIDPLATPAALADEPIADADRTAWRHHLINKSALIAGRNLLAVQVHQVSVVDNDLAFDLQLTADVAEDRARLSITEIPGGHELAWPAAFQSWRLWQNSALDSWQQVPESPLSDAGWIYLQKFHGPGTQFFQLQKP